VVDVVTGPNLWEPGAERRYDVTAWATALKALETICERGERLGVKIGFEPCWGTLAHDAATAERVLAAVPVSITLDPSHFVLSDDEVPELVRRWGERIVNVHLKDAFGRPGMEGEDFHFCLLGEGRVPWAALLAALEEVGYEGAMAVEFEAFRYYEQVLGSDPDAAARLAASQVEALLGRQGVPA
jgi:sugar phosphate isomerase/epimerase